MDRWLIIIYVFDALLIPQEMFVIQLHDKKLEYYSVQ